MSCILEKKALKRANVKRIDDELLSIKKTAKRYRESPFWTTEDYEDCCTLIRCSIHLIEAELWKMKSENLLINSIKEA